MAGSNTVILRFIGEDSGLRHTLRSVGDKIGELGKLGAKGLAALGAGAQPVMGLVAALQQLSGAALLLPGAIAVAGAAMGTFKLATLGVGDAMKSVFADSAKFNEAIKGLAPNAQGFLKAIRAFKPEVDALKKSVQDDFFRGFADDVKALGATYFPMLQKFLPAIATQFNAMGKSLGFALNLPSVQNDVREVLWGTLGLLDRMPHALANVAVGLTGLAGVGATYMPRLGDAISSVADKFRAWVDRGVESGKINDLIDSAIAGFKDLGAIVGSVGSTLATIFKAVSGGMASSPLSSLLTIVQGIGAALTSGPALEFFAKLGEVMRTVVGVAMEVAGALVRNLAPILTALLPVVEVLARAIGDILVPVFDALGPPLEKIATALAGALIPAIQQVVASFLALLPTLTPIITQIGELLVQAIQTLTPLLPPLIKAFFDIVAALLPVIPPLLQVAGTLLPMLGDILSVVVWIITNIVVPIIQALGRHLTDLANVIGVVVSAIAVSWDWLKGALSAVFSWMQDSVRNVADWFRNLGPNVKAAVGNFGTLLTNAGRDLLTGFWNGLQSMSGWLQSKVTAFFSGLVPDWARDALGIGSPSKVFAEIGKWVPEGMAKGITDNMGPVLDAVQAMTGIDVGEGSGISDAQIQSLMGQGWRGVAGDNAERLYSPTALRAGGAPGGQSLGVNFSGSVDNAVAKMFMELVRTGKIQLTPA
jgi:phage-related protein